MPLSPTSDSMSGFNFCRPLAPVRADARHGRGTRPASDTVSRRWTPYSLSAPETKRPTPVPTTVAIEKGIAPPNLSLVDYFGETASISEKEQEARRHLAVELQSLGLYDSQSAMIGRAAAQASRQKLFLDNRYSALTALPPLSALHSLRIQGLPLLSTLPENLWLAGDLSISDCCTFQGVPQSVLVLGDVSFAACPELITFSPSLAASGSLSLSGPFPKLSLPKGLRVESVLSISDDPTREELFTKGSQNFLSSLRIQKLPRLTTLNLPTCIPEDLVVDQCGALFSIQRELRVGRHLTVTACNKLRFLACHVSVGRDLTVSNCGRLEALCEQLWVGRDMSLNKLSRFRNLLRTPVDGRSNVASEGEPFFENGISTVERSVTISQAPRLEGLPDTLHIECDLWMTACPGVVRLPGTLFGWLQAPQTARRVSLVNTGLQWFFDCERLERLVPGVVLVFHGNPTNIYSTYDLLRVNDSNLSSLLKFFHSEADYLLGARQTHSRKWLEFISTVQREALKNFLWRLLEAQDLSAARTSSSQDDILSSARNRQHLIVRVSAFLEKLSKLDGEWEEIFSEIEHATGGCVDRVVLSLGQIERLLLVQNIDCNGSNKEQTLRELGGSLYRQDLVQQWAFKNISRFNLNPRESTEIILYLENKLRVDLMLPVHSFSMNYPHIVRALHGEWKTALEEIQTTIKTPGAFENYLQNWEPWQKYQREILAEQIDFSALPLLPPGQSVVDGHCIFTLEAAKRLKEAVFLPYDTSYHVYELADLLTWWVQKARHPISSLPMPNLAGLRRLA